ncbi:PadR family transcriptional regulator [Solihabitans fulvus]|uniref:PadR family transcriptional regulator n=2 Tax=Solihabitans fulvus TaxID=1892852 RepID=A0A5B2XC34_9PSEU|nr:PadR family transcriptional regulator [Solihabitans fulvus]
MPDAPGSRGRREHSRGHGHGRGGGRQRRGNVRAAVLALLAERSMHGYEMIQEISKRTNGVWRPSPGSVYPTLQLLADEGMVTTSEEAGGKRLFSLTDEGRAEFDKLGGSTPWEQVNDDVDPIELQLRTSMGQLFAAMQQMAHAGTSDQKARAVEALNGARRQIYNILGEIDADTDTDIDSDTED